MLKLYERSSVVDVRFSDEAIGLVTCRRPAEWFDGRGAAVAPLNVLLHPMDSVITDRCNEELGFERVRFHGLLI